MSTPPSEDILLFKQLAFCLDPVQPASFAYKSEHYLLCGGFARLYLGTCSDVSVSNESGVEALTSSALVVKAIDMSSSRLEYRRRYFPRDTSTLAKLSHPSLASITVWYNHLKCSKLLLRMEYAPAGSLLDLLLASKRPVPEDVARRYYRQFGSALQYMHSQGVAHRNVKCEKILLFSIERDAICKLSDYGFTRSAFRCNKRQPLLCSKQETYCPSVAYLAPEVLLQKSGGIEQRPLNRFLTDVWSVGVVLYAMVHGGKLPFQSWNLNLWIASQRAQQYSIELDLSDGLKQLIRLHLMFDPSNRAEMATIMKHHWLEAASLTDQ